MSRDRRILVFVLLAVALAIGATMAWFIVSRPGGQAVQETAAAPVRGASSSGSLAVAVPVRTVYVRGTVIEEPSQEPVFGATITLATPSGDFVTTTAADGTFELESTEEQGMLLVEAPGLRSGGRNDHGLPLRVPPGEDRVEDVQLVLYEPSVVSGRVRVHGRAAEATVVAWYERDRSGAARYEAEIIETDADGRFRLIGLAPGRMRLRAIAPGAAPRESALVDVWPGETVDVGEIELRAGGAIVGRVLDRDGKPVGNARVWATTQGSGEPAVVVRSNEFGVYALYGVAAGEVLLHAEAPGLQLHTEALSLAAEEEAVRELALEPLNGIVVRVVDARGAPVSGALVEVFELDGTTPLATHTVGNGPLYLSDLEGGPFRVEASALGQESSTTVVVGGTAELVLAGSSALRVRVLRADGTPAHGARLVLVYEGADGARQRVRSEVALDGSHLFEGLVPGRYLVLGSDEGHRETESTVIEVVGGESSVTVQLATGGVLLGTVRDAVTGQPIAGAQVRIDGGRRRVQSDGMGGYRLAGFPGGRTSMEVEAPGYRGTVVSGLEVRDGQQLHRDVELSPLDEDAGQGRELELVGVGMRVNMTEAGLVVVDPVEGSAGARAGLRRDDVILAIDGADPRELGMRESIERIRGEEGTTVTLRVQRGEGAAIDLQIMRERVVFRQ